MDSLVPKQWLRHLGCLVLVLGTAPVAKAQLLAFPGAEGAGQYAVGGRGGDVYVVTNLNNSGPGSLRYGIDTANGPRTILFNVSGTIHLSSNLVINKPNLTIAGQSAPGGGITIEGYRTHIVDTHDVILQFMRFRVGDEHVTSEAHDALWVENSNNVMIDHVSASWSIDEGLSVTRSNNVSVQWSYISEALKNAGHSSGAHSYGSLINGGQITYHHNLYASNDSRNPRPQGGGIPGETLTLDFVNNVIANPGGRYGYSGDDTIQMNYVGNYGIDGPSTSNSASLFKPDSPQTKIYFQGNYRDSDKDGILDGTPANSGTRLVNGAYTPASQPFDIAPVQTTDARQAYIQVLSRGGASGYRDAVDRRIVRDVMNQKGAIIDSQDQVGGWPSLPTAAPATDTNGDGIPDWYAVSQNWDVHANIANQIAPSGYTYLETYLHSLTPKAYAPQAANSQTIVVPTTFGRGGDATLSENGGNSAISAGDGLSGQLNVRFNGSDRNELVALKFDLSGIEPGSIVDARLELTAFRDMGSNESIRVYGLEHDALGWDWDQNSVEFATGPGLQFDGRSSTRGLVTDHLLTLGTFNARDLSMGDVAIFDNANLAVFLNLAAFFEDMPQSGLVTILLERVNTSSSQTRFASGEATQLESGGVFEAGTFAPRLVIQGTLAPQFPDAMSMMLRAGDQVALSMLSVPEPSSLVTMLLGVAGLACNKLHKRLRLRDVR
jgi:pectate lyase